MRGIIAGAVLLIAISGLAQADRDIDIDEICADLEAAREEAAEPIPPDHYNPEAAAMGQKAALEIIEQFTRHNYPECLPD